MGIRGHLRGSREGAAAEQPIGSPPSATSHRHRGVAPPLLRGGWPFLGHLLELRRDPLALMKRLRAECGEIGEFRLAGHRIVLLTGEEAQEAFFRAPDQQLDQAAAYPFMKPIFGEGVVFDATPEQRKQAMRNQSLRDKFMRGHAEKIAAEVERMTAGWPEQGEVDLLGFFSELTLYTSTACLIGPQFREELGPEFARIFMDLERGTDALAYVNPYLPIPALRARDRARRELAAKIEAVFERRARSGERYEDLFQVLHGLRNGRGERRYSDDQITGMFISMMFAGHHTTSVVSSWGVIDLLQHPAWLHKVVGELDEIYADGRDVSYQALREIPLLECALKETLRLHPPLVILMRKAMSDFHYKDWTVPAGNIVAASPAVSNRMPEHFPDPEQYLPERYLPGREEDHQSFAWLPFGAGRHRCVGAAFAMMQLKAIFSVLLRRYEFELAQPSETYANDLSKMVVAVRQPCRVRYRRRAAGEAAARTETPGVAAAAAPVASFQVRIDLDLCQGHAVCMGEAPEVFDVERSEDGGDKAVLRMHHPAPGLRAKVEAAVRHCPTRALSIEE
jgi:sterol 14-demethylase